jgi:hypothetical protein
MPTRNTVSCPGCRKTLRVGSRVISDGQEYWFYLCPTCEDVALRPTPDADWELSGETRAEVPALVSALSELAADVWRRRSTSRKPLGSTLSR